VFLGIQILMHAGDHAPPHFHVRYAGNEAVFLIPSARLQRGRLSPRVVRLVREWAALHVVELLADWDLVRAGLPPRSIAPLE
jgi:hypothetical protein